MLDFDILFAFDANRLQGVVLFCFFWKSKWLMRLGLLPSLSYVICVIFRSYGPLGCERHLCCLQRVKHDSSWGAFFLLLLAASCLGGSAMERTVISNHAFLVIHMMQLLITEELCH